MNKKRFAAIVLTALVFVGLLFGQGPVQKVRLWDTNLSHSLLLNWNEDRTAGYTLNWIGITADRTITLQGNPTLDNWFDQSVKTTFSPTFVTVKLSALTDGYVPYHVADATGLANSVIRTDGTLVGVGMLPTVAQLEVNTSQIITSTTAAPYLKIENKSDTARDPIIQWAVGATPVTKFTMGVDDSDTDKFKVATGSEFGQDHDVMVVSNWDGSSTGTAEFTLIDTWQTPISGTAETPAGVCTDGTYLYYSTSGVIVKIDPALGTEVARTSEAGLNLKDLACDGTYVYARNDAGTEDKIRKYQCSDLVYVSQSEHWHGSNGFVYYGGYLYIVNNVQCDIRKTRCSDMQEIWTVSYTPGSGDSQFYWPLSITIDGAYLYILDYWPGLNNRIVRLDMAGAWVDHVDVANTIDSDAIWIAREWIYVGTHEGKVDKLLLSDLSFVEQFAVAATDIPQAFHDGDYHYLASADDTCIYQYQFVSSSAFYASGILYRLRDTYGEMKDLAKLTGEGNWGVGTIFPTERIEAVGNIKARAGQFISTKATGTAPVVVSSTTVCTNLNAGLVDGFHHDQSLLIAASPTFVALNLSATSNQVVLQSAGITGTITATPASSNKVWTLQDVTGTIYQTGGTDVAVADGGTNKSAWTLYAIPYASGTTTIGEIAIGTAGQILAVNGGANGYEWIAAGGGGTFLTLTDVDEADYVGHEAEFVVVNGTADGLVFSASSVAGHTLGGVNHTDVNAAAPNDDDFLSWDAASGKWIPVAGGGGGAPTDAKYIVQEVNAGLSAEQSLGALATGIVKNTTTGAVGVLSIATATDIPAVAISTTTITATGATNWNKVSGARWCLVRIWAGGGSGARGADGTVAGSGGGGGAYIEKIFDYADLSDPVAVTIGAGGAAVSAGSTDGNVGGNTTFGAYLTAYGGGAGVDDTNMRGGGGGGGAMSAGSIGAGSAGGKGGDPGGGVGGSGSTTALAAGGSGFGGGGGGCASTAGVTVGGGSGYGGGGGGGGTATNGNSAGGPSLCGGGGGGGGSVSGAGSAGGTSTFGGTGGAGSTGAVAATAGTQPGGGGGGSENANSGAGGDGKAVIISF